jgi:hypothetical protein
MNFAHLTPLNARELAILRYLLSSLHIDPMAFHFFHAKMGFEEEAPGAQEPSLDGMFGKVSGQLNRSCLTNGLK